MSFNENLFSQSLQPGRELDALIAEKVMGYKNVFSLCPRCRGVLTEGLFTAAYGCFKCQWSINYSEDPILAKKYSTEISAAFEVVEKTKLLKNYLLYQYEDIWVIQDHSERGFCEGTTAPHVICLAALKAIGVEK